MVFGVFNNSGRSSSFSHSADSLVFRDGFIDIYSDKKETILEDEKSILVTNCTSDISYIKNLGSIKDLDGSFYLLRYDKKKKELDLGIDRLGIGDLFYSENGGSVFFATKPKELFKVGLKKEIDPTSLRYYLVYQFIPRPLTMFKGVFKVPAASVVKVREGLSIEKYWDLRFDPVKADDEEYHVRSVRRLLVDSIKESVSKLRNQKIGLLLSGGLDSSIIAYTLKELGVDFYTFTGVYPYDRTYGGNRYGIRVAQDIGSKHQDIEIGPDSIRRLPEIYDYMDEPLADSSLLQAHIIMDCAKKETPNLFAGEFSDILFAGMQTYVKDKISSLFWQDVPVEQKILAKNTAGGSVISEFMDQNDNYSEFKHYKYGEVFFTGSDVNDVFNEEITSSFKNVKLNRPVIDVYNSVKFSNVLDRQIYTDLKIASQRRIFHLTEPAKVNDVNLILPYTYNKLVDYSGRIPGDLKIKGFKQKYVLKKAFEGRIPGYITERQKEGFTAPFNLWFKQNKKWILDQFDGNLWSSKVKEYIGGIIDKEDGRYKDNMKVWILLNLSIWYRKVFLEQ